MSYRRMSKLAGWLVFALAAIVYFMSAERTGSLWDCGEFIAGAYKLEVVHPPGAPLFLIVGRLFTLFAETLFPSNPAAIAFSVNMMSGLSTAFAAAFVGWATIMLSKLALVGREKEPDQGEQYATILAGVVAGLTTAFCSSIWFSAVEGEVYAMSTFFTALTVWAMVRWYYLPDNPKTDRWLVFVVYAAGLSIGVHLLSLLTFPALALLYYFKKYKKHNFMGMLAAAAAGTAILGFVQLGVIIGLTKLWFNLDYFMVNSLGLPLHSGLIPLILILAGITYGLLNYAHKNNLPLLQLATVGALMVVIGFSTIGVIVIRANANTPINMNTPSNAARLMPYLNREQYGERALVYGPWYGAKPIDNNFSDRYDYVDGEYKVVDEKVSYEYAAADKMLFPRMGDGSQNRSALYEQWRGGNTGKPTQLENLKFFWQYQISWMYGRYFMWNFAGRQNGDQGFWPGDPSSGHWISGIKPLDEMRLHEESEMPERMAADQARNKYYMLPLIFGLLGLFFHLKSRPNDAYALIALFIITGIGIIVYSNQPPNEPRERDYVLIGSFFTFAMWVGMGALFFFELLRKNLSAKAAGIAGGAIVLLAPMIMLAENFDDNDRSEIVASRDYAHNFLESCEPNSIIFTYGDNDTYPLWYAQEVENIRTDVRVVNLSLIAVDWYIEQLRRKVNDSPALNLTIPSSAYKGGQRNLTPYFNRNNPNGDPNLDPSLNLKEELQFIGTDQVKADVNRRQPRSYFRSHKYYIPINESKIFENGLANPSDTGRIVNRIPLNLGRNKSYLIKDELAVLDVITSNINERPIYFAVTCRAEKLFGLQEYMQLEGLALRLVAVNTPTSPQSGQYGRVYGAGRVATDEFYDNVVNKFAWGNLDQERAYISSSYAPSLQSFHLTMLRAAEAMALKGENEKALALCDEYLIAFPQLNFQYDYRTLRILNVMVAAGGYEMAKPHLEAVAAETREYLDFYTSLDMGDLEDGFRQDFQLSMRTMDDLVNLVRKEGDTAFLASLQEMFAGYLNETDTPPPPPPPSNPQDTDG
ncbi:MAG: DUF2723 domain-containing protein [Bacteroidetes bacterium]|nr:DUF2723 domain-containing protein [Bacteroidota bacterium]